MANTKTFPCLGDLDTVESLGLMCLIEYVEALVPKLEPLLYQVGCIEPDMLKQAVEALAEEKLSINLMDYELESVPDNTVRQYFTRIPHLTNAQQQNILTTFYEVQYIVGRLKEKIPYNHDVVVGMAMYNIINVKRVLTINNKIALNAVNDISGKLILKTSSIRYFTVLIGK